MRGKIGGSENEEQEEEADATESAGRSAEVKQEMKELTKSVLEKLPQFANSPHMEVQERVRVNCFNCFSLASLILFLEV